MAEVGAGVDEPWRPLMPFGVVADVAMVHCCFCGDDRKFGRPYSAKPGNSLDVAYSRFRLAALNRIVSG